MGYISEKLVYSNINLHLRLDGAIKHFKLRIDKFRNSLYVLNCCRKG